MNNSITPGQVMATLDAMSQELNSLADGLASVARQLEPVQIEVDEYIADFEIGLWEKHTEQGCKLPAAALRIKMAHRSMKPELYGRYVALVHSRDRMVKRISTLKTSVEAQRSLLSALKEGLI
jgi:hypothetical protein